MDFAHSRRFSKGYLTKIGRMDKLKKAGFFCIKTKIPRDKIERFSMIYNSRTKEQR